MPTVLRIFGLRVVIYPNDHRPEHVHVIGGGAEAVFLLNCSEGNVILRENFGFSLRDINRIEHALNGANVELCRSWESIHGRP